MAGEMANRWDHQRKKREKHKQLVIYLLMLNLLEHAPVTKPEGIA